MHVMSATDIKQDHVDMLLAAVTKHWLNENELLKYAGL